jgi:hypothetical protein
LEEIDHICAGEGLLYLSKSRGIGRYQFLPFFVKRERDVTGILSGVSNDSRRGVIQGRSKVVESVTYDEGKRLADWLFGDIDQFALRKLRIGASEVYTYHGEGGAALLVPPINTEQIRGEGLDERPQLIDVLIGPLNL